MTREELLDDIEQFYKEETHKLETVNVRIYFSGYTDYEFDDCTQAEAERMAREEWETSSLDDCCEAQIDRVE